MLDWISTAFDRMVIMFGLLGFCGWAWRYWLRKHDPVGYERQSARDAFVKKHGMALGGKLLKKWMK